jgi:hypothetical protein
MTTTPTKISLYDVALEGAQLEEILIASDGEITPEIEDRLDVFLKSGKEKIDAACKVVASLDASAHACGEEARRLLARAESFENNKKALKARILGAVDAAFDGKVKTNLFTVWGQNSAPTVGFEAAPDADLASIQQAYPEVVRTKYELDKTTLKSMRAQGVPIPEAISVIEGEGTRFLRIK